MGKAAELVFFAAATTTMAYYLIYGFFYLLSLLPWRVLYLLSDGIYGLVYYVFGYRKAVVLSNLAIAFPEKSEKERIRIAKDFYRLFIDTFIEMVKLISVNQSTIRKRVSGNLEMLNDLIGSGQSIVVVAGHYFNWEFANLSAAIQLRLPFLGVYMPLSSKVFDRIIYRLRSKFGTILIAKNQFRNQYHAYSDRQHVIGLVADQSPGNPMSGYWYPFFGKMTPIAKGPEKTAKSLNAIVVPVHFYRVKRGYYRIDCSVLTTTPQDYPEGVLTRELIGFVEDAVRRNPANYLWSHRRWKHPFSQEKYGHLVIDAASPLQNDSK